MVSNRQKKKRLFVRAFVMTLFMALFTQGAMAQTNVYMHTGSSTLVGTDVVKFYDSGGESSGPGYYWERWFQRNEDYTYTFKAATGYKVKVTFKQFTAYTDNNSQNPAHVFEVHPMWALRLNTAELSIYDGMTTDAANLITTYTGSVLNEFTVMSSGSMTFHFHSYGYREEGWYAEVQQVLDENYAIQKPAISFQVCDDQIVINPNNKNVKVYYTTDGSDPSVPSKDPLSAGILYVGPFSVEVATEVRAIAYDETLSLVSGVASLTYTQDDVTPIPGKPTIKRMGNTITMEPAPLIGDINETYEVWYKTEADGIYEKYENPIEWSTPNTTFYAITKPVSCSDKISAEETLLFDKVQVPDPTVEFKNINATTGVGTVEINCPDGYVLSYTTNGSDPTTTGGTTNSVTLTNVAPGTTVKAIAYKVTNGALDPNYKPSNIVTLLCLPGGEGESGTYGSVVILDDREKHDWTYYSDEDSPIHSLKPADIKITYKGYGVKTMTKDNVDPMPANSAFTEEVTADKVAVNINEAGNQFIYLKTLENAKEDGTGNYPYSMIPNPFQKRPTGQSNGNGNMTPTTRSIAIVTSSTANWTQYDGWDYGATLTVTCNGQTLATIGNTTTTTVVVPVGQTVYLTFTAGTGSNNQNGRCRVAAYYDSTSGTSIFDTYNPVTYPNRNFTVAAGSGTSVTYGIYRGFYAWRVKSLSGGLTIQDPETRATYGVNSIIYADQEVEFVTANQEGNEVEFEALWAQALLNSDGYYTNSGKYQNAYERNFKRVTTLTTYSGPVTISSVYPDGSETTVRSVSRTSNYECSEDVKLENMTLAMPNYYLDGNNHSLIIGRGVANGTSNVASAIYGEYTPGTTKNNFTLRVESGRYDAIYGLYDNDGTTHITNDFKTTIIYGSDYDRANDDHTKLIVAGATQLGRSVSCANNTVNETVLSGTFGNNGGEDIELYMGWAGTIGDNSLGTRKLEVFDGIFKSGIAGGIEQGVDEETMILTMRIHGGTVPQYVYQSGQYSAAYGSRRTIITGGTFEDWIAGGCYGTGNTDERPGTTNGDIYIYFGGDAKQTANDEGIFGAGYGNYATASGRYNVNKSFIVVADEAQIAGSVYGGGNNGYCTDGSEVYVNGTTLNVAGSVYGGANLSWTEGTTTVTVKDGTITGSVYGGAQGSSATSNIVYVTDKATVNIEGGTMTNVYGGGLGAQTRMNGGTEVNVSGGTINNNVYGGGALGTVPSGDTHVNVSGGTMKDVYGAGQGGTTTAQVSCKTYVNVTGGTIANVYGGGEAGDVMASDGGDNTGGPLTYDFEDGTQGWTFIDVSPSGQAWSRHQGTPHGGEYCMRAQYNSSSANQDYLVSPQITLGGALKFYARRYTNSGDYQYDRFRVWLSTSSNSSASDFSIELTNGNITPGTTYTEYTYDLSSYSGQGYVAIQYTANADMYYLYVDDITIEQPENSGTNTANVASTVTIQGGNISGDVFGGGKMGLTQGNVQVDVEGGNIRGNVFGGAYGEPNKVFVAGMHTVNIMGGRVFGNVYGGSRNANDALAISGYDENETKTSSVVNISAGQIDNQVYTAGYYGKTFGSVYTFIGTNAIINAPHSAPSFGDNNETEYKAGNLRLGQNVWAGGDWGSFTSGSFGASTVSGYSDIYVDGDGYNTETTNESAPTYMNIAGSIYGCGTSCDAGKKGRAIVVSNYGKANGSGSKEDFNEPYSDATRSFYSLQRADTLVLNNTHVNFTGQAKIYSLDATEKYAIVSFDKTVRIVGGSSLFMNAPSSQIWDWWNASCDDVYLGVNATYTPVAYNQVSATPNKIRVNGGNYIEVYHNKQINSTTGGYGMLNGFAYMMVSDNTSENTCAYARPKWCETTPIDDDYNNEDDGGWVSYDVTQNTVNIAGYNVSAGSSDQMPYENHINSTKAGEQYFRIWRCGGYYSEREAVVNILADGNNTFGYVDVSVKLPAWRSTGSYYKFQTTGQGANLNTTIDYGADVMMYNSALIGTSVADSASWVRFYERGQAQQQGTYQTALNEIRNNPNVNFGLVALPGLAMAGNGLIVCNESDAFLAKVTGTAPNYQTVNKFTCDDFEKNPEITFRFTYSNLISTNMTWDPMYITLVQVDENGEKDIVKIAITINVATTIDRVFTTQTYAIMNSTGSPNDEYVAKVVLPTFEIYNPLAEHLSQFKLQSVTFEPETGNDAEQGSWIARGGRYDINHFAMEIGAATNEDNTDGWNGTSAGFKDSKTNANASNNGGLLLGETGGREPFAFDFRLTYKGDITYQGEKPRLGMLTFTITYDNVKVQVGTDPDTNEPIYQSQTKTLIIKVDVIRRGKGELFYLDGQHGSNANDAHHPDKAVLSLSTIFNRCGFLPGDIIYIVNQVDVDDELEWTGTRYNGVTIYRYPGGHPLSQTQLKDNSGNPLYLTPEGDTTTVATGNTPIMITGEIVDNEDNVAYEGALINVKDKGDLIIRDITLDGHMSDHTSPFSTTENPKTDAGVESESPMIVVSSGGTLVLTNGATLQENNSSANGGGVAVNDHGFLMMNENASIANNVTSGDGGAVYMAGTLIVSDSIQLINNTKGTVANNVYLAGADNVVQIGTTEEDEFGPLSADGQYHTAQIGVTKTLYGDVNGYTKVVYVENSNDIAWLETPYNDSPNSIIFHDGGLYQLEKYNDPQYLYWIGTWVTVQHWNPKYESEDDEDYDANDFDPSDIDTPAELAWFISHVNGLNGASAHPGAVANITGDIDMDESIWVPIGTANTPFAGTFKGNGHVITGIHSILVNNNAGIFGVTKDATIQDVVAQVEFDGNSINKGSFIGTMNGGTLANVEAAGTLIGKDNTVNMGGLVGLATSETATAAPVIHSGFAVNTMKAEKATTVMGGLVGSLGSVKEVVNEETGETTVTNYQANLYNSYANITLGENNAATNMGGLVGVNNKGCTIGNCYVINPIGPAFAFTNSGTIEYCYAAKGTQSFVGSAEGNADPVGHGTYDVVKGRKELGYMYGDNAVTAQTADTTYVRSKVIYDGGRIKEWPGLLSTLNQWVKANPKQLINPAPWLRPISGDINGDLPVLCFAKDNCFATQDGKFLQYSAYDLTDGDSFNNGLDNLLITYKDQTANIFLYGNATKVENVPTKNVNVFINEDAVLLQEQQGEGKDNTPNFINTTVGITFDNSCKSADDYFGNTLEYDWHLMSTPLADAPLGITYGKEGATIAQGQPADWKKVENSYMPNMTNGSKEEEGVKWDFYTYFEPQYHWINFKRSLTNHWHYDEPYNNIDYSGNEQNTDSSKDKLIQGRGYMMAINQDSYLNNTGTLNNGQIIIPLTVSHDPTDDPAPTKDWGSNLVGNPYQAYLDLDKVTKTGQTAFYVYDADNGVYGPYMTTASENDAIPSKFIHPHQAFFVVTSENDDDFAFTYEMATTRKNDASYFRGEEQPRYPLVNLFVENGRGSRDLAIIEFNRPELNGVRKVDNLRNANFKVSGYLDGEDFGLMFTPEGTERVPVHFRTEEDGTFTMKWQTLHGTFTSLMLVDNLTGTRTDMLRNDHYTFNGSVDDYAARFYITYNVTHVDEINGNVEAFAWYDGNDWIVNGKGQLEVVDMTGRVLYSQRINGEQVRLNLEGYAAGVYMLRVSGNKNVKSQKIVVK